MTHIVEIVGEAAAHVPESLREAHPGIPWNGIIGMRNRLIHGYIEVDLDVLWKVVQAEIPPLIEQLEAILAD